MNFTRDKNLKGGFLTHRHQLQLSEANENLLLPYRVICPFMIRCRYLERSYSKSQTTLFSVGFFKLLQPQETEMLAKAILAFMM